MDEFFDFGVVEMDGVKAHAGLETRGGK
jgi:hypothetical protein